VTGLIDEDTSTPTIHEVSVWYHLPLPGVPPLIMRFEPKKAKTPLQQRALEALETAYGIDILIESIP
jgi:hypothetical protein